MYVFDKVTYGASGETEHGCNITDICVCIFQVSAFKLLDKL